jgi:hypothetical protein
MAFTNITEITKSGVSNCLIQDRQEPWIGYPKARIEVFSIHGWVLGCSQYV